MTGDETKAMLLDLLVSMHLLSPADRAAAVAPGSRDISFGELGIDSMAVVELCTAVEEKTGRELRVEEIIDNPTVDLLAAHLASAESKSRQS